MPFDIGALAQETAGGVIGTGMGLLLEKHNDRRQIEQEKKLQQMQIAGQKEMGEFNLQQQMKLWEQTNYGPQMEQLKKAGLNPGLIYGMSGGGGQTAAAQPGNVGRGDSPKGGGETLAAAGMGIQMAMQKAQIDNLNANTEKTKVEAEKTAGVDTDKTKSEIASLTQGVENQKAVAELTKVQTKLAALDQLIIEGTLSERMDRVVWESLKVHEELETVNRNNYINKATQNAQIDIVRTTAIGAILRNALTRAETGNIQQDTRNKEIGVRLTKQQISNMAQQIQIGWAELSEEQKRTKVMQTLGDQKLEMQGVSEIINAVTDIIEEFVPKRSIHTRNK